MKPFYKWAIMPLVGVALLFTSCKKETPPPTPVVDPWEDYVKIGETRIAGAATTAAVYMVEEPFTGYNKLFVVLKDSASGALVDDAVVNFYPEMDMGSMTHSAPWEGAVYDATLKAFVGTVTFTMPSIGGTWKVDLLIENNKNGKSGVGTLPVTVIEKAEAKIYSFTSGFDGSKMFVALVQPTRPKTGIQDFEVVVYEKETMMSFPPVNDLVIEIEPEMPSMGHGSPNNVNPVFTQNGHYVGAVNFTMTGYWRVNITIKDANGNVHNDAGYFDLTFTNIY